MQQTKLSVLFVSLIFFFASLDSYADTHKSPILTTTAVIEVFEENEFKGIVLIERGKAPWGKAIPAGKVEYGETIEEAVRREMMEELHLTLHDLKQFPVYSNQQETFAITQ